MTTPHLLATFFIGDTHLAIDAAVVQEVLYGQQVFPVPGTERSVLGLMNLRGQVVTTIDLARRMGTERSTPTEKCFHVVVRTDEGPVSLVVDNVSQVFDASDLTPDPPPDTLDSRLVSLVSGVHQREGNLLLVLDVAEATAERGIHADSEESTTAGVEGTPVDA
jgi:purine-binding chemotaxis protein CheW